MQSDTPSVFVQMTRPAPVGKVLLALGFVLVAGCGGESAETTASADSAASEASTPAPEMTLENVGFATPESVLHDVAADLYLVSNINGAPLDKDGNGFISRVSPEGEVLDLKWIDGAADGVTLNGPKGMAISRGQLYVADIDCLRVFDAASGAPIGEHCVSGATFLNDVAADDQANVYFTDMGLDASFGPTGADAIYLLSGGTVLDVARGADLGNPNGVAVISGGLRVVTFGSGESYRVTPTGERLEITTIAGSLDGVEPTADGGYLVSSWDDQAIYHIAADGARHVVVEGVEAPADIGLDRTRNRILIPLFNGNSILFRSLEAR